MKEGKQWQIIKQAVKQGASRKYLSILKRTYSIAILDKFYMPIHYF
jgi:hypothetical protein